MGCYDTKQNLNCLQFEQVSGDTLYLAGNNCICSATGTISSNSGYKVCGVTLFNGDISINSLKIGCNTQAINNAISIGSASHANGDKAVSIGCAACACGSGGVTIGANSKSFSDCNTVLGCSNVVCGSGSGIIGGYNNLICSASTCTTIVGGHGINLTTSSLSGFVIVPSLAINTAPAGSGGYLCWNASTKKVEQTVGSTGSTTGITGGASLGSGCAVFASGDSTTLSFKSLVAGTNVTLGSDNDTITINASGGGGSVSAANGLTYDGTNVVLGGALTGDTVITGNYTLNLCGTSNLSTINGYQISGSTILKASTNNISSIYLGLNSGSNGLGDNNFGVGAYTLKSNTTGYNNIAVGYNALCTNTVGTNNVSLGYQTLYNNTTGGYNVAIGCEALLFNETTGCNIGIGVRALYGNQGSYNIGIGIGNMCAIGNGTHNIALGFNSLKSNTSGIYNISMGACSLCSNTSGQGNVGLGYRSLMSNTTGSCNLALMACSLISNISGSFNIGIGRGSLTTNTSGLNNVAIGSLTLYSNSTGCNNVAIGLCAGYSNTSSNRLFIANSATKKLIYGEFDNEVLCIRGKTYISGLTNTTKSNIVYYDSSTKELTYGSAPSSGGIGWETITSTMAGCNTPTCSTSICSTTGFGAQVFPNLIAATGKYNTSFGTYSSNCTNCGCHNSVFGYQAFYRNQGASCSNTIFGAFAACVYNVTPTCHNVAIGFRALQRNYGSNNTAIGYCSGPTNTTASCGVYVGINSGVNETSSNRLHIANNGTESLIYGEFDNKLLCFNSDLVVSGYTTSTNFILSSDERLKTDIKPIICSPIDVEYKEFKLKSEPDQLRYGVIAQELCSNNPELVRTNCDGILSVAYIDLLVKEVAFLKHKVNELEDIIKNNG